MNPLLDAYRMLLDALRCQRLRPDWKPADDRDLLERIGDLFDRLDDDTQELARAETWRGWPDQYEARVAQWVEATDPDDPDTLEHAPRRIDKAA